MNKSDPSGLDYLCTTIEHAIDCTIIEHPGDSNPTGQLTWNIVQDWDFSSLSTPDYFVSNTPPGKGSNGGMGPSAPQINSVRAQALARLDMAAFQDLVQTVLEQIGATPGTGDTGTPWRRILTGGLSDLTDGVGEMSEIIAQEYNDPNSKLSKILDNAKQYIDHKIQIHTNPQTVGDHIEALIDDVSLVLMVVAGPEARVATNAVADGVMGLGGFASRAGAAELPAALRGGAATTDIYYGIRAGERVYVGITNNLARRQSEHGSRFILERITSAASRGEARAIEEAVIVRNPGFENLRHSISPRHPWYREAVDWAEAWLKANGH